MKFWAHPRSRGEHLDERKYGKFSKGSSPLARGTRSLTGCTSHRTGLIPARAGNTGGCLHPHAHKRAHPRSRGEHTDLLKNSTPEAGSSPLARGTHLSQVTAVQPAGLIPARAGNTHAHEPDQAIDRAHPRSRGEHGDYDRRSKWVVGSSPLARGTPQAKVNIKKPRGLIPARAGNTVNNAVNNALNAAHPRSRGEHRLMRCLHLMPRGSSPLARGTPIGIIWAGIRIGLIPARAGNTRRTLSESFHLWAHPRSRGEHVKERMNATAESGSSPLARGTRGVQGDFADCVGLIPARAGNTLEALTITREDWAHPRSRGEHKKPTLSGVGLVGSSPLARGTRRIRSSGLWGAGLIPARAGNTYPVAEEDRANGAHPRSRGEHAYKWSSSNASMGSSPLARGTQDGPPPGPCRAGLIPARAGNTQRDLCFEGRTWAHPRSRGEHRVSTQPSCSSWGSSPLARGTLPIGALLYICMGLIPARAGNTRGTDIARSWTRAHPRSRGEHQR